MALLEVCCGCLESVDAAVAGGARRIELCTSLELDGLTPPISWIREVKARYPSLIVHVLIRPRAGDFVFSNNDSYSNADLGSVREGSGLSVASLRDRDAPESPPPSLASAGGEKEAMARQVEEALEAGADGIVIGGLTPDGDVDIPLMERLLHIVEEWNLARELAGSDLCHAANDSHFFPGPQRRIGTTFHRAFDVCRRPFDALEQIVDLGFDHILTSGQAPTALEGVDLLRQLHERARGRIGILPGGGVTPENAAQILSLTGCTEIHASASEVVDGKRVTSAAKVTLIRKAVENL